MRAQPLLFVVLLVIGAGCENFSSHCADLTYSYYRAPDFSWDQVNRLVVLPLANETRHPTAAEETRLALTQELQQLGRFEVVAPLADDCAQISEQVRLHGRFDERLMLDLGRKYRADVILCGTVTDYQPYARPRLGLVLQVISPSRAVVAASVDGLWDAGLPQVAEQAQAYYTRARSYKDRIQEYLQAEVDNAFAADVVLSSPILFRRFVCHQAATALVMDLLPATAPPRHHFIGILSRR